MKFNYKELINLERCFPFRFQMEAIVEKMQAENTGVSVRTVKAFMTKIPSVFSGSDLVQWILKNLDVDDTPEALHLAHLLASYGYLFPIVSNNFGVLSDFITAPASSPGRSLLDCQKRQYIL